MCCGASKADNTDVTVTQHNAPAAATPVATTPVAATPVATTPVASEPAKDDAPTWKAPEGAVFHRLTKIPIKSGSMSDLRKVFSSAAMQDTLKTFVGFLGVETLSVDDTTMLTHSRWVSEEACSGGAAALGAVLKEHFSAFIAGPPDAPWVGARAMELKISDTGPMVAYRVVIMALQEGKMQAVLDVATSKLTEFQAIDGLVNITSFEAGKNAAVVCAGYTSKAALEAATPKIGAIMKEMGANFAGPPTSFLTEVEFSTFDFSAAAVPAAPVPTSPFAFASGLPDCCTSNPGNYKVAAELPGFRMVEMTMAPGEEDTLHDHPSHSMFFVQGGKLSIRDWDPEKKALGEPHEVEPPSGAPPIFPAGAHQVKNVGDTTVKCIFIEAFPSCQPVCW